MKKYFVAVFSFMLFANQIGFAQQIPVRKPAVAGAFYPADPKDLSRMIDNFLNHAKTASENFDVFGLIAPHAGYVYSGIVAAQGYKQLIGRSYDVVIVISPSHAEYFPFSSVLKRGVYRTPFGEIRTNQAICRKIAEGRTSIRLSDRGHFQGHLTRREHALEVQLPFLQKVLGDFSLVPIVMGEQSFQACQELAEAIYSAVKDRKTLIVASSDLSHFHPYQEAKRIDGRLISAVKNYDYRGMFDLLQSKKIEACGGGPIITMLMAARKMGASTAKILMYANSGDTAGDRSSVVGYLSVIVGKPTKKRAETIMNAIYTKDEREELLKIAKLAIEHAVKGKDTPVITINSEKLKEKRGAFVTINKYGQLRGCIGYTQPVFPLYQTVMQVARAAALEDPRFPAVTENELEDLEIEISVLTLPEKIKDISEIEVGKHGLIVKKGYYQGLLLPQVATEYDWDRLTFLEQTCRKAGLPQNAWKDADTEIFVFSAEVFGEH